MARRALLIVAAILALTGQASAAAHRGDGKLDAALRARAHAPRGTSRVIIQTVGGGAADPVVRAVQGIPGRRLPLLGAQVAEIPDAALESLADHDGVRAVVLDRPVRGALERTGGTVGSTWVQQNLGFDGAGIGVAIIDSGVTSWHDDLGSSRVVHFADFVNHQPLAYDDYGHGTHVAGILAGSGHDSGGARRGLAPGAHLVVLKVLDAAGDGFISNVIAALDYAVDVRQRFGIRVINLSVAAGVYESFETDPLTQAAKRAVDAGLVVVTAAGNGGRNAAGKIQYGAITAPGNAPWVLTVGAASHMGTTDRGDDTVAAFSSRGPSYIDYAAKPDLVAPGVGIESLADATSTLFLARPAARLWGTTATVTEPYFSMSGTSMAAPVVAGTVALMLQANPALTPNAVKAVLQYTAEENRRYNHLTQGAGFLNARGAVELAQRFAEDPSSAGAADAGGDDQEATWSRHIIWGNHRLGGAVLAAGADAWRTGVVWGASTAGFGEGITFEESENIVWGTDCGGGGCENIVWGTSAACESNDPACENIVWGTSSSEETIVWGRRRRGRPSGAPPSTHEGRDQ